MAIMNRIAKLFKADINGIIDVLEDPKIMLKQALRDMEHCIDEINRQHEQQDKHLNHVIDKLTLLSEQREDTQEQIRLSLENNNESLARDCVKKKLEQEQLIATLYNKRDQLQEDLQTLIERRSAYEQKLSEIQAKADIFQMESEADTMMTSDTYGATSTGGVRSSDIEIELLRQKEALNKQFTQQEVSS